jgi:hypothetical protein
MPSHLQGRSKTCAAIWPRLDVRKHRSKCIWFYLDRPTERPVDADDHQQLGGDQECEQPCHQDLRWQGLAHPGGDITGLPNFAYGLAANRVEYLKAIVPNLSRVALLVNPNDTENVRRNVEESQAAADKLKLFVRPIETRKRDDIAAAFSSGAARTSIGLGVPSAPQCLIEVSNQITGILDSDGKPN